jgi:hypothetical protein
VSELTRALAGTDTVVTIGLILQEILQGLVPGRARSQIIERFANMPLVESDRDDYT